MELKTVVHGKKNAHLTTIKKKIKQISSLCRDYDYQMNQASVSAQKLREQADAIQEQGRKHRDNFDLCFDEYLRLVEKHQDYYFELKESRDWDLEIKDKKYKLCTSRWFNHEIITLFDLLYKVKDEKVVKRTFRTSMYKIARSFAEIKGYARTIHQIEGAIYDIEQSLESRTAPFYEVLQEHIFDKKVC